MIAKFLGIVTCGLMMTACVHEPGTQDADLVVTQPATSDEELAASIEGDATPSERIDTSKGIPEIEGPYVWGDNISVRKFDRFYISGQPDETALETAKADGIYVIVNLREANEMTWDEEAYVKKMGMIYYNVPVASEDSLDTSVFADIDEIEARHNGKILIHDSTGNRSAAWFASHLATEQSLTLEKSLEIGKSLGLNGEKTIQTVQAYINSYESDNAAASEEGSDDRAAQDNDSENIEE